jgi:hypothetical protein
MCYELASPAGYSEPKLTRAPVRRSSFGHSGIRPLYMYIGNIRILINIRQL